jgi:hypothetical protein
VACIDVHEREGKLAGPEGFFGQPREGNRVFAARKQQRGPLKLTGYLAQNVNSLGF